jgi:imidazolonepropionase-like amidohydrolase
MNRKLLIFGILGTQFIFAHAQFIPGHLALRDVSIVDVVAKKVEPHCTVIISGKRIESVGPSGSINIPDSAMVINCSGKFLIPGLIDSHVHLATDPSGDDNRRRAERDLQNMLLSGITSVRDMAGDARDLASLSRDANLDEIISPDIYYAALMAGPNFFSDPRTHLATRGGVPGGMPFMRSVTDSLDLRLAVAEAKGTGATAIKLYSEISGALAKKITEEAHRQDLLVWSHANLDIASPLDVINAGVNSISHSGLIVGWNSEKMPDSWIRQGLGDSFWDSAFVSTPADSYIDAMLKNKTVLDATMIVFEIASADTSIPENRRLRYRARFEIGKRFTQLALRRGVPICAGTDVDDQKFVQREIKLMVKKAGFTPMQALVCATRFGALALGIEKTSGTIERGKIADVVLLTADPVSNIDNLDKVELVIKNGRLYNAKN